MYALLDVWLTANAIKMVHESIWLIDMIVSVTRQHYANVMLAEKCQYHSMYFDIKAFAT